MLERTSIGLAVLSALALGSQPVQAQSAFKSGYYEISSGLYTECCGFAPITSRDTLPDARQRFIELIIGPDGNTARLTFLGPDLRTVVTNYPWSHYITFPFTFSNGVVFPDHILFAEGQVTPAPEQASWHYIVRDLTGSLAISGIASVPVCANGVCVNDVPTDFEHTNVVATFLPNPVVIDRVQREGDSMLFHFTGRALYDYYIEYTDSLTTPNWQTQAGYRAKVLPIDLVVTNSLSAAQTRYFRIRSEPCNCR